MSHKKEIYKIKRNEKGQFDPRGEMVSRLSDSTQRVINERLSNHVEKLYGSVNRLRWGVWALLAFDVVMTYGFVRFSREIVSYLINVGGL